MKIEVIDRQTREHKNALDKDFIEFMEWLSRAMRRGYKMDRCGEYFYIHSGKGQNDFRVYER